MSDAGYAALGAFITLIIGAIVRSIIALMESKQKISKDDRAALVIEFQAIIAQHKEDYVRLEKRCDETDKELERQRRRERQCSILLRWTNSRIDELEDACTRSNIAFRKAVMPKLEDIEEQVDDTQQ